MEVREGQYSGIVGRPLPTAEIYEELGQATEESQHTNPAYQSLLFRGEPNTMLQTQPLRVVNSSAMSATGNCGAKASDDPLPDHDYMYHIRKSSDEEVGRHNSYPEPTTHAGGHHCLLDRREPSTTLHAHPQKEGRLSGLGTAGKAASDGVLQKYEQHKVSSEPFNEENDESDSYHALEALDVASPGHSADPSKQNPAPFDEENQEDEAYHGLEAINVLLTENSSDRRIPNSESYEEESQNKHVYPVLESSV